TLWVAVMNLPGLLIYLILRPSNTLVEAYERSLEEESLLQDIESRLACPNCQQRVQGDFLVCPNCLSQLKRQCPHCSKVLLLKWSVCPYCAHEVGAAPAPLVTQAAVVAAEEEVTAPPAKPRFSRTTTVVRERPVEPAAREPQPVLDSR